MTKIALDTNILIYNHHSADENIRDITGKLLFLHPVISAQVVSEYLNVMKRLLSLPKSSLMALCAQWMMQCDIHPVEVSTIRLAERLISRYDFQIFDSIIIASALEANCSVLYSEDMHHQLKVEGRLYIVNPFL
jgi:predicted nucleic acid-binding protein